MQKNIAISMPNERAVQTMNKYIFPCILIACDVGAAIVYACNADWKMALYWLAATVLNCCVTF